AAKPDSFAIGSISKRDRSGSGDEAAPVYPVKHPTMSYAGAAKGRPAAQTVDESIYHWYAGGEKQKLKKLCIGGSDCKIGCSWDQFGENPKVGIEGVNRQLFDIPMVTQHDRQSKATYFIASYDKDAERNTKVCETLSKYCKIKDTSARFIRDASIPIPFDMKILLFKTPGEEIPNTLKNFGFPTSNSKFDTNNPESAKDIDMEGGADPDTSKSMDQEPENKEKRVLENSPTVEETEVVYSLEIKVETPDFLLSSSPGPDFEDMRLLFNEISDDQSAGKSFFNRELIKELGVIGDPIPEFSDKMDEDLLE
ncbi:hypothetical protein BB560_004708, partial [Smittium megazygosporum]